MSLKNKDLVWNGVGQSRKKMQDQQHEEFFNLPILNDASKGASESEPGKSNRRDFLKYVGFSVGAAAIAASCETPIRQVIPYVTKPDAIVPGIATYYASSFFRAGQFCPILVKTREGRPIKIEGNGLSSFAGGGTSARVQASVLDLYDQSRYREPFKKGENGNWTAMSWADLDTEIIEKLKSSRNIRLVTNTIISPAYQQAINHFTSVYNAETVVYDAISSSAILLANEADFGKKMIPGMDFSKADLIVSFGADFLGTWISPVQFTAQYAQNRKIKDPSNPVMNKLVSVENGMSLTGSNADQKIQIRPSEQGLAIATLYNLLGAGPRVNVTGTFSNEKAAGQLERLAAELKNAKSSLVVSDSNNTTEQRLINRINRQLGNYERSILPAKPMYVKQGVDQDLAKFRQDLSGGRVDAVIFLDDANPLYDSPYGREIGEALKSVPTVVSCQYSRNESAEASHYLAPVDHFLEAWGDLNPSAGYYAIQQPTIHRIFNTRSAAESLLVWSGHQMSAAIQASDAEIRPYHDFIRTVWETEVFPLQETYSLFASFWDSVLHDGYFHQESFTEPFGEFNGSNVDGRSVSTPATDGIELKLFEPIGVGNGIYANNPWLQEMPDPVTRVVWDNTLHVPIHWNGRDDFDVFNGLDEDGALVEITIGEFNKSIPTVRQFGQFSNTVSAALGYGRTVCGRAGQDVGVDFYPVLPVDVDGNIQYYVTSVNVSEQIGTDEDFAIVQYHHTMGVTGPDETEGGKTINVDEKAVLNFFDGFQGSLVDRTIIRNSNLDNLQESMEDLAKERANAKHLNEKTLYPGYEYEFSQGHHWGMSVDLTACIGCGACLVACMSENNVPVVGKHEVHRHHEMTWLRIDRYYYGDVDNPQVVYQPMMCQHCDNAPCENVCPVAATPHSAEGLNHMAYNRCIGTRYCANNCPYKVRRFNWLDYTTADTFPANESSPYGDVNFYTDDLVRMVLNPDVTVRSRGVMEKCSMCIQRIQEGKLKAKVEGRALMDGEVKTACQTACPTGGIIFGDVNNKDAEVNELLDSPLTYYALEEVNTRSSVGYKMKVSNRPTAEQNI